HPEHSPAAASVSCSPQDTDCDGLDDVKDDCPFAAGDLAHKGCPDPNLPPPAEPPCAGQPADLGPDGCAGKLMRRFGALDANRINGHPCFTGSDPIARACSDGAHSTRNGAIPRGSDGSTDGEDKDGRDIRRSWTFGASLYGSVSVGNLSAGGNAG